MHECCITTGSFKHKSAHLQFLPQHWYISGFDSASASKPKEKYQENFSTHTSNFWLYNGTCPELIFGEKRCCFAGPCVGIRIPNFEREDDLKWQEKLHELDILEWSQRHVVVCCHTRLLEKSCIHLSVDINAHTCISIGNRSSPPAALICSLPSRSSNTHSCSQTSTP